MTTWKDFVVKCLHLFTMNQLEFRGSKTTQKPFCGHPLGEGNPKVQTHIITELISSELIKITHPKYLAYTES